MAIVRDVLGRGINKFSGPYMGIEIETEYTQPKEFEFLEGKNFQVEHDHSLMNFGYEYITRKPKSLKTIKKDLEDLFQEDSFNSYWQNSPRASIHVHCNVQDMELDRLMATLCVYYLTEELIFNFVRPDRRSNLYCLGVKDASNVIWQLNNLMESIRDGRRLNIDFNNTKYSALNIGNITRLGTIEFRQMECTQDLNRINQWLDIVSCIHNQPYDNMEEVWDAMSNNCYEFLCSVFGKSLDLILPKEIPELIWREQMDANVSFVFELMHIKLDLEKPRQTTDYFFINPDTLDSDEKYVFQDEFKEYTVY